MYKVVKKTNKKLVNTWYRFKNMLCIGFQSSRLKSTRFLKKMSSCWGQRRMNWWEIWFYCSEERPRLQMQPSRGKLADSEISCVVVFRSRGGKPSPKFCKTWGSPPVPVGMVAPIEGGTILSNLSAIHLKPPPDRKIGLRLVLSEAVMKKGGSALF